MFGLNKNIMQITSEKDFPELRKQYGIWKKRFPMFTHDVLQIEKIIETHITEYSKVLVKYRQTKQNKLLEKAQYHIDEINRVLTVIGKMELMAMLSRR